MSCEDDHSQMNDGCGCGCCMSNASGITRRDFMTAVGATGFTIGALGSISTSSAAEAPLYTPVPPKALKIQPVLTIRLEKPRKQASWRNWGGFHNKEDIAKEKQRIQQELRQLQKKAEFPMEIMPLVTIDQGDQAAKLAKGPHDVMLIYAANSGSHILKPMTNPEKWTIMFLRHKSGPVYLWYEIAHPIYLRKNTDEFGQPGIDCQDVVVDEYDDVLWRMRALYGLKNTIGKKVLVIDEPDGWGAGSRQRAPRIAKDLWKMDFQVVPYKELGEMIKKARQNSKLVNRCGHEAGQYLKQRGISLHTKKEFDEKAFVLNEVFKNLLDQAKTDVFTIGNCMDTVIPISETTACLPITLLCDSGYQAYCESDFVVVPAGILLHHISSKSVFMCNPTYAHHGMMTLAHCTAPRKMDGKNYEPAKIVTHFESDYGAAPKVEMKLGQKITVIKPDFMSKRWLGFEAEIIDNPFLDICRTQIDVKINGDCDTLNAETRGFQCMTSYGNYLNEVGYALKKMAGVGWLNLSKKA